MTTDVAAPPQQQTEAELRIDLAAAYRAVALFGWDDLIYTHISVRIPGPDHHFLINPYGMHFDEITASSLVKIDLEGNKIEPSPYPINPAGFVIHSAIHAAREDAQCVLHVHYAPGVAVSIQPDGLQMISQHASLMYGLIGYHDYEGIALRDEEKPRLVNDLGGNLVLILRNHGLLTVGSNIGTAFVIMCNLVRACEIQVMAQSMGGSNLIPITQEVLDHQLENAQECAAGQGLDFAWGGIIRKLDRIDPSFRD